MLTFEIVTPKQINGLIGRLHDYDEISDRHFKKAMHESVISIEGVAIRNAPVGVSGRLKNSMASEVKVRGDAIIGRVGSTLKKEVYPKVMDGRGRVSLLMLSVSIDGFG